MKVSTKSNRVIVTGGCGQLAQAMQEECASFDTIEFIFLDKKVLDITDPSSITKAIKKFRPSGIINTAAYTAVDAAEDNQERAFLVNAIGVENLVKACLENELKLIHVSTDYVFDGLSSSGYHENDLSNPKTVYGMSKRDGEIAIQKAGLSEYAIVRTSWVYSKYGTNFVKKMISLAQEKKELKVVDDQEGSPTFANTLAIRLMELMGVLTSGNSGVYHYANGGSTTWYGFATAIFKQLKIEVVIEAVRSDAFKTKAKRPKNSVLHSEKIEKVLGRKNVNWETGLKQMLETL